MPFRVGDIVRRIGGGFHQVVKRVNGSKLNVVRIRYNEGGEGYREVGDTSTLSERNFELVHTDWKEKELWVILFTSPRHPENVRQFTFEDERTANDNRATMIQRPDHYSIISQHKITIPYKGPQ